MAPKRKAIHSYISVGVAGADGNKYTERGNRYQVWRAEIYEDGTCRSIFMDEAAVDKWWETRSRT